MSSRPYVIIRTYSAGVHFGELDKREWKETRLVNCRRLWSWRTKGSEQPAMSLHEISLRGVGDQSIVSEAIEWIVLTETIEVLPCTPEAEAQMRAVPASHT